VRKSRKKIRVVGKTRVKCVLSAEKSCEISVKAMRIPVMHFMTGI